MFTLFKFILSTYLLQWHYGISLFRIQIHNYHQNVCVILSKKLSQTAAQKDFWTER